MARIVTLQHHYSMAGAIVAQSVLDHHGIPSFLFDRHIAVVDWNYLFAIGGLRLSVFEHDRDEALALLAEVRAENPPDGGEGCCPACGSDNIFRHLKWLGFAIIFLLIVYDLPSTRRTCFACGHKWRTAHRNE